MIPKIRLKLDCYGIIFHEPAKRDVLGQSLSTLSKWIKRFAKGYLFNNDNLFSGSWNLFVYVNLVLSLNRDQDVYNQENIS